MLICCDPTNSSLRSLFNSDVFFTLNIYIRIRIYESFDQFLLLSHSFYQVKPWFPWQKCDTSSCNWILMLFVVGFGICVSVHGSSHKTQFFFPGIIPSLYFYFDHGCSVLFPPFTFHYVWIVEIILTRLNLVSYSYSPPFCTVNYHNDHLCFTLWWIDMMVGCWFLMPEFGKLATLVLKFVQTRKM